MTRPALAGPILAAVVAVLALCPTGCGTRSRHTKPPRPSSTSSSARLTVAPADAHPRSVLRFTLVAPSVSGRHGEGEISYVLSVSGVQRSRCVGEHSAAVTVAHPGQPVDVAVGPAQLGGPWCTGSYAARAEELERPVCRPTQVCPQFIRVMAVIGPVRFRITR